MSAGLFVSQVVRNYISSQDLVAGVAQDNVSVDSISGNNRATDIVIEQNNWADSFWGINY